jgi:hypothetical protein
MQLRSYYAQLATADVAPINRPTAVLTPRSQAALSLYRFVTVLREFDVDDRRFVLELLASELGDQSA